MDEDCHYALAASEQASGEGPGLVELGDGRGAVLRSERGQRLAGPVAGERAQLVESRLKELAQIKAATLVGCPF